MNYILLSITYLITVITFCGNTMVTTTGEFHIVIRYLKLLDPFPLFLHHKFQYISRVAASYNTVIHHANTLQSCISDLSLKFVLMTHHNHELVSYHEFK